MSKLKITKSMVYIDGVPTHKIPGMAGLFEVSVHHKFHERPEVTFKLVFDEVEVDGGIDKNLEKEAVAVFWNNVGTELNQIEQIDKVLEDILAKLKKNIEDIKSGWCPRCGRVKSKGVAECVSCGWRV